MEKPRLRYHHLGIPTPESREDEYFLPAFGMHVTPHETNPFRIEWMRFEEGSPLPELVKTVPHIAFQVENLDAALEGYQVLIAPNSPSDGVRVAFVVHDGVPVEFLEFESAHPDRLPDENEEEDPSHD